MGDISIRVVKKIRKYNKKLLPRQCYRLLDDISGLKSFFLCRNTNRKRRIIKKSDNWDEVWDISELRRGMSVNLLSVYTHSDAQIIVTGKIGDSHFERWNPADEIIAPPHIKYHRRANFIGVRIDDILNITCPQIEVTFKNGTERKDSVRFDVQHCPTKCNFWHFEIGIVAMDPSGNEYNFENNNSFSINGRKRYAKQAAEVLKELIKPSLKHSSECYPIYLEKGYYVTK